MQAHHLGAKIGTICCATSTCADDIAVLSPSWDGEDITTLAVVVDALSKSRIKINESKTEVLNYEFSSRIGERVSGYREKNLQSAQELATWESITMQLIGSQISV